MVLREKGESGDDSYRISARLVHGTILTILASLVSLGGYMTVWAINDVKYKTSLDAKIARLIERVTALELLHTEGIHPIAKERIEQLERRVREIEAREPRWRNQP